MLAKRYRLMMAARASSSISTLVRDIHQGYATCGGLPIERVDHAGLAGDAGHHLAHLARFEAGVDPGDGVGVRGDRGVDEQALERMVEVPVVARGPLGATAAPCVHGTIPGAASWSLWTGTATCPIEALTVRGGHVPPLLQHAAVDVISILDRKELTNYERKAVDDGVIPNFAVFTFPPAMRP